MSAFTPNPDFAVASEAALRGLFQPVHELAGLKSLPALDKHASDFIARAPFLVLGTEGADGRADVSPRGDPPGFVKILDPNWLAIPDRPGNNRLDSLANIVVNPGVGLLFIIPGFDETMRVNGRAELNTDPAILGTMTVNDRTPKLAILVRVDEVFIHCAKAFRRAQLWNPDSFQDRRTMPTLSKIILDQTKGAPTDPDEMKRIDDDLEQRYRRSMY